MKTELIEYQDDELTCEGFFASEDPAKSLPCVLIGHAWGGLGEYERDKAEAIAKLGYHAFAIDMYGKGVRGSSVEENRALMTPLKTNRTLLRKRILAALTAAQNMVQVEPSKIAAIGYCFGGLCVLDLARSGVDIRGAISVHGLLTPPDIDSGLIKAKVLALHGYDDPMVPPEQVLAFASEMTNAGVDWQLHAYGLTQHAFTNPKANNPDLGTIYNKTASERSWITVKDFLEEVF